MSILLDMVRVLQARAAATGKVTVLMCKPPRAVSLSTPSSRRA